MNGWTSAREPEKPKTLAGRRELAKTEATETRLRLEAWTKAAKMFGNDRLAGVLEEAAAAITNLVGLMPPRGR